MLLTIVILLLIHVYIINIILIITCLALLFQLLLAFLYKNTLS